MARDLHFSDPSLWSDDASAWTTDKFGKFIGETQYITDKAKQDYKGLAQEQYNTDPLALNKNNNSNYAMTGGQYGLINGKDYGNTIALARRADAYNNAPMAHMFSVKHQSRGGTTDMGTGINKPMLKTMETRAMDQAFNLDTQQKQLAQQLQAAVDRKDWDAYVKLYTQLYGAEQAKMSARNEFLRSTRMQEVQAVFTNFIHKYRHIFERHFTSETIQEVIDGMSTDPTWANMFNYRLNNFTGPQMYDIVKQIETEMYTKDFLKKHGVSSVDELSPALKAEHAKGLADKLAALEVEMSGRYAGMYEKAYDSYAGAGKEYGKQIKDDGKQEKNKKKEERKQNKNK